MRCLKKVITQTTLAASLAAAAWAGACAPDEQADIPPEQEAAVVPEEARPVRLDITPQLVPLPKVDWKALPAAVRQRIRPVYELAEQAPDDPEAVGRLGMSFHAHSQIGEAETCYERARALAPNEFRWGYNAAIAAKAAGKRGKAAALLRASLDSKPDYGPGHVRLADSLLANGEIEASEKSYRRAMEIDDGLARAHYGLGRLLLAKADLDDAVAEYERACVLAPNFGAAHYALGLAYRRLGRSDEAEASLALYEQLKSQPEPSFDPIADAVTEMGADSGVTAEPTVDLPPAALEQVAAEMEKALEGQPWLLSAHANLIAVYWELRQPQKAREHYQAALKIDPNDAVIHYNWGLVQALQGNRTAAAESFRKALEINPRYADAQVQFGVLLETRGESRQALDRYRKALAINPTHRRAHFYLGLLLARGGALDDAIRHLRETVKIDDRQTPAYLRALAGAYGQRGDHERALDLLRRARARAASFGMRKFVAQVDSELQVLAEAAEMR